MNILYSVLNVFNGTEICFYFTCQTVGWHCVYLSRKGIFLISCMLVVSVSLTSGPLRPLRDIYLGTTRTVSIFWETQRPGAQFVRLWIQKCLGPVYSQGGGAGRLILICLRIEGSELIVIVLVVLKCYRGGVWVCVIIPKNLQRPHKTPLLLRLELTQTVVEQ